MDAVLDALPGWLSVLIIFAAVSLPATLLSGFMIKWKDQADRESEASIKRTVEIRKEIAEMRKNKQEASVGKADPEM